MITEQGKSTRFYKLSTEIAQFVYSSVSPKQSYIDMYNIVTDKAGTPKHMENLLTHVCDDIRLPVLDISRHLFAFNNGLLDVKRKLFFVDDRLPRNPTSFVHSVSEMPAQISSANYFAADLDLAQFFSGLPEMDDDAAQRPLLSKKKKRKTPDKCAFEEKKEETEAHQSFAGSHILTPTFDKILIDQKLGTYDIEWVLTLMARAMFDVNEMDSWQVIFFLRGVAGSGKSTLLKLLGDFYPPERVGSLMSDAQTTFSDEHIIHCLVVLAMDADSTTTWSRTRFNSYASGEVISVNRKNKLSIAHVWAAHLFLASNGWPSFEDAAGNVARRFVIVLFEQVLKSTDTFMFTKLKLELPNLLLKCVLVYHDNIKKYGKVSLWDNKPMSKQKILPDVIWRARREFLAHSSPFEALFASDALVFGASYSMTIREFRSVLQLFQKNNSGGAKSVPLWGLILFP